MTRRAPVTAVLSLVVLTAACEAQQPPRPAEVTEAAIAAGRDLFLGAGNCQACHGADGRGSADGPDLTDDRWSKADGTYGGIVKLVTHGVPSSSSATGRAMPVRGWEPLDDAQVRAVAAYVWSLSHRGAATKP